MGPVCNISTGFISPMSDQNCWHTHCFAGAVEEAARLVLGAVVGAARLVAQRRHRIAG